MSGKCEERGIEETRKEEWKIDYKEEWRME